MSLWYEGRFHPSGHTPFVSGLLTSCHILPIPKRSIGLLFG